MKRFALQIILASILTAVSFSQPQVLYSENIADGVNYYKVLQKINNNDIKAHSVFIDLRNTSIEVKAALAKDTVGKLQSVPAIAQANDALAAINGTFFDRKKPRLPIGLLVIDGDMMTKSLLNRTAIGISGSHVQFGMPKFVGKITNKETGEKFDIWGINRPRKNDEIIIYTPEYGNSTRTNDNGVEIIVEDNIVIGISSGNSPIPENGYVISFHGWTKDFTNSIPPGSYIEAEYDLSEGWADFDQVFTGGPRLIDNKLIVAEKFMQKECFDSDMTRRNARTAIGVTENGLLLMVVVDGGIRSKKVPYYSKGKKKRYRRVKYRTGITYSELTWLMKEMGAVDAMGLDGGGSSTMYVNGRVVNTPSDGYVQAVSNAIIVKVKD